MKAKDEQNKLAVPEEQNQVKDYTTTLAAQLDALSLDKANYTDLRKNELIAQSVQNNEPASVNGKSEQESVQRN